jgi:hypothetical protein
MTSSSSARRWRASPVGTVAGALTVTGLLLATTVDMRFLVLAALGTFGPGVLRELHWLHDQDEFQRQAARRAGYHAYLAGGIAAVLVIAGVQAGSVEIAGLALAAALVLAVMWLTWLFSCLLDFFGPQRAASRTLVVFGVFWLMFVVLSHLKNLGSLPAEGLVVLPFFVLAWATGRWPRVAGVALLLVAAATIVLFGWLHSGDLDHEHLLIRALTFVIFEVPLLASGLALLRTGPPASPDEAAKAC